jgi:hypothetical protein
VKHFEDKEQEVVFQWAMWHKELRWMHSIPNGGKRDAREAARLKSQGQTNGVSDIFLPVPKSGSHGLYIEMKRRKQDGASRVTKDQQDFIEFVREQGYKCVVCYGADEAINNIKWYMGWLS